MAFARATVSSSGAVWPNRARADTVQPLADGEVVGFGDAHGGVNAVQQGLSGMTGGYPVAVGIGDLVIEPGEGASCCPADEGPGLPVQSLAFVLLFFGGGGLWPGHDSELRQAKARAMYWFAGPVAIRDRPTVDCMAAGCENVPMRNHRVCC
jgi:hypothetical protein